MSTLNLKEFKVKEILRDLTSDIALELPCDPIKYLYDKLGTIYGLAEQSKQGVLRSL